MECTHVCKCSLQYVWMTLSYSIVAPQYPWGVKNKSLMQNVPNPPFVKELAPRLGYLYTGRFIELLRVSLPSSLLGIEEQSAVILNDKIKIRPFTFILNEAI